MSVYISRPSLSGYGASAVSMSFDTNTLVISNAYASSQTGTFSTFTYTPPGSGGSGNVWSSAITINGTSNSNFGQSASMNYDGTRIAVGAPNIGKVYIYDWNGSGWSNYSNIIQCPVTTSSNNFGYSVSLSPDLGDRVAIGAPGINTAYVYELKSNNQWTQTWLHTENTLKSLITCDTSVNSSGNVSVNSQYNNYGFSVALSLYGDFLAIGAPGTDLDEVNSTNSDHNASPFTYNGVYYDGNISYGNAVGPDDADMEVVGQVGFVQVYKGGLTNTQSWWTSNALVGQTMYGDAGTHNVNFDGGSNWYGTTRYWKEAWSMPRMGYSVDISDDGTRVVAGSPSFSAEGTQNALYPGKIELFDFTSSLNVWTKSLSPLFGATARGCAGHSFKLNSSNNRIVTQDLSSGGFSVMDYSGSAWYQNGVKNSWMTSTPTYGDTVLTACTITNGALIVSATPGQNNGQVQFYNYLLTNTLAGNTLIGGYMAADEIFLGPSDNSLTNAYDKKISFGGTYADNSASLCTIERRVHDSSDLTGASELLIRHTGETESDQVRLNAPELIFQVGGSDTVTAHMHINKEGNVGIGSDLYASTFLTSTGEHWKSRSYCTAGVDISKDVQIRNKLNINYSGRTALAGKDGHTLSRLDTRDNELVLSEWASSSQNVTYSSGFRAYDFAGGSSYIQGPGGSTHQKGARFGLWLYLKNEHSTYTANNSKGQVLCALGTVPTPAPSSNRFQGCSLYLFYNSASDRGFRFWLGESNRYYVHQMDLEKGRWYCIDVKFPGQYTAGTTTSLQPKFYDGVGNGGEGTTNAPNSIADTSNTMLLLVDSVGKNLSVSGSGGASVSNGSIYAPNGYWFGGNNTSSTNDGYGIHNAYMGLMYKEGGSGHQSAQPSVLFANGSPPEMLAVGGDILTNGRIGIGTVQPNAACHVIGDFNVEGEIKQNNSTLIGLGSSSSAGAPLQVLASTSNTSPTNNGILLKQEGTSGTNHAIMAIQVAGANSGDPFVSWDNSVTGWSMGIDSDDDKLKIANSSSELQTDTHMEFSSAGTDFKKAILANGSTGTSGQVLTSGGTGPVSWTTVSGGGGSFSGDIADYITHTGDANTYFGFPSDDTFIIKTNGTERLRANSSGNIGIGTASPGYKLDVNGDINMSSGSSLRINGVAQSFGGGGGSSLSGTNTFEWGTGVSGKETNAGKIGYSTFTSGANGALDIVGAGTGSSNRNVRIWDYLGIGTGSPTSPLHVIGDAFFDGGNIYFNKTSGSVSKITSSSAGDDLQFYSDKWIRFIESDNNAEKLVINGNEGKIGINHSTPDSCLHIASSSGQTITLDGTTRTSYIHYVRGTGHWYAVVDNNSGPNHNMYWYSNTSQSGNPIKQIFRFENDTAGAGSNAIGTFTGQHMSSIVDVTPTNVSNCVGLIVSSNQNDYMTINGGTPLKGAKNIHVNEAIPVVKISTKVQDKACFGVISSGEDSNESGREQRTGRIVGVFHKESGDNRVYINSIGEGGVWVVNTNGNLEAGDYITTSNVSGYGMKQTSEFLANYTVAKITMDCNFNPGQVPVKQIKKVSATNTYYVRSTDNDTCNETFYNTLDDETKALYTRDVRTEMVNDLDSNGVFQWEDTSETELAYTIRYLDADGIETTQGNAVHIAAFVGCTYHCG